MTQNSSDVYLFTGNLIKSNLYEQFAYLIILVDSDKQNNVKEQEPKVSFQTSIAKSVKLAKLTVKS